MKKKLQQEILIERLKDNDSLDWCCYCKDNIFPKDNHVVKSGNYYHLECYDMLYTLDEDE